MGLLFMHRLTLLSFFRGSNLRISLMMLSLASIYFNDLFLTTNSKEPCNEFLAMLSSANWGRVGKFSSVLRSQLLMRSSRIYGKWC